MADEWFVDIGGGGDASQVSAAIARVLGLAAPRYTGDQYELILPSGDSAYVEDLALDEAEEYSYPVWVAVNGHSGDDGVAANARWLYDALSDKTDWGLRLANGGGRDLAERKPDHRRDD